MLFYGNINDFTTFELRQKANEAHVCDSLLVYHGLDPRFPAPTAADSQLGLGPSYLSAHGYSTVAVINSASTDHSTTSQHPLIQSREPSREVKGEGSRELGAGRESVRRLIRVAPGWATTWS